jgi:hypothetical protein
MLAQRRFRYDIRLGAQPGRFVMTGEETEVIRAIFRNAGTGRWVHSALVHHVMPPERQTIAYIKKYYESCGWLAEQRDASGNVSASISRLLYDQSSVLAAELRFRLLRTFARPKRWMPALVNAATARGRWLARYQPDDSGSVPRQPHKG